jgi:hypothetical protein
VIHSSIQSQLKELTRELRNNYYTKPLTECNCKPVGESVDQCKVHEV